MGLKPSCFFLLKSNILFSKGLQIYIVFKNKQSFWKKLYSSYYLKDLLLESGCKYIFFLHIHYKILTIFLSKILIKNKDLIIKLLNYIFSIKKDKYFI